MWSNLSRINKILIILTIIVIPFAILVTVLQVQKKQTIRQRASEGSSIVLGVYPNTASYTLGQSIDASIILTNNSKDISGVDFVVNYDPNVLQLDRFDIRNPGFTTIINNSGLGRLHYAAINSTTVPLDSVDQFDIGTLHFTSLRSTENDQATNLDFVNPIITAANHNDGLPISQDIWQYTIKAPTSTLQPTSIPTPITSSNCFPGTSLCGETCYQDPCYNGNPLVCENSIPSCETTSPAETPTSPTSTSISKPTSTVPTPTSIPTLAPNPNPNLLNYCYQSCGSYPEDDRNACYNYCDNKYGQ